MVELTLPQTRALIAAAIAMLAGDEGQGDAQDVNFRVLTRAVGRLIAAEAIETSK